MRFKNRVRWISKGLAALALCGVASAADALTTNSPSFRIPFAVEATDSYAATGTAILFASKDGGPLEQIQRVNAQSGGFQFLAPTDGRYAFAVRMTDPSGRIAGDAGQLVPELEVVVDTTPPVLEFQLAETGSGEMSITWRCNETAVAPESLRLEHAEGTDGRWLPVQATSAASGQTAIHSRPGNSVFVRGFITDLAGNRGGGSGQIVLTAAPDSQTVAQTNAGSGQPSPPGLSIPGATNNGPEIDASQQTPATQFAPQIAASQQMLGANPFQNPASQMQPTSAPRRSTQTANPGGFSSAVSSQYPVAAQIPAPVTQSYPAGFSGYSTVDSASAGGSAQGISGGQIVNNRVFDIAYEVQDVGPSGVSAVQLFVTENNGQEWFRYGDDVDLRSPFQVDTRGEGTFGFAVRVRNGLGFTDMPPQPGQIPSVVVTVDQTPPVASLSQPQIIVQGEGKIRLNWNVTDSHPSPAAVRLEYAVSSSGPWTPIFDWQVDQHNFEMPIQPGMPNTLHFRLLARDAAGNVATAQTPQPVLIDQHRPTVRLLSIQPVSATRGY